MNYPQYAIIEASTGIQLETHQAISTANQAVKEINSRWGDDEVFVQKIQKEEIK
jgi:hypothetical protein